VAVAVDGATPAGPNGKPGAYAPRSTAEMQRIDQLVRSAVGYDASRGDQINVINVRFDRDAATMGGAASIGPKMLDFDKNDVMRGAELLVLGVVAALIIFFVVRPLLVSTGGRGPINIAAMRALPAGGSGGGAPGGVGQIGQSPVPGEPLALPNPDADGRIDIARIEGQVRVSSVKSVSDFVERHPEESVSILRGWLHEA
jgi:flagellar M-ring protein FliF